MRFLPLLVSSVFLAHVACSGSGSKQSGDGGNPSAGDGGMSSGGDGGRSSVGDGGPPATMAVVKFCNPLSTSNNESLTISLDVGTPPVTLTATSGTCVPRKGDACTAVPVGQNIALALRLGTERLASAVIEKISAGEELLIFADLDDASGMVTFGGGPLEGPMVPRCADLAFADIFEVP